MSNNQLCAVFLVPGTNFQFDVFVERGDKRFVYTEDEGYAEPEGFKNFIGYFKQDEDIRVLFKALTSKLFNDGNKTLCEYAGI